MLKQELRHDMQFGNVFPQNFLCLGVAVCDIVLDFCVDLGRCLFGVGLVVTELFAQKDFAVRGTVGDGSKLLAHAVLGNHREHQIGGTFDIVRGTGRNIVQNDGFRHTTA